MRQRDLTQYLKWDKYLSTKKPKIERLSYYPLPIDPVKMTSKRRTADVPRVDDFYHDVLDRTCTFLWDDFEDAIARGYNGVSTSIGIMKAEQQMKFKETLNLKSPFDEEDYNVEMSYMTAPKSHTFAVIISLKNGHEPSWRTPDLELTNEKIDREKDHNTGEVLAATLKQYRKEAKKHGVGFLNDEHKWLYTNYAPCNITDCEDCGKRSTKPSPTKKKK